MRKELYEVPTFIRPSVAWLEEQKKGFYCFSCKAIYFYWNDDHEYQCNECYDKMRHRYHSD